MNLFPAYNYLSGYGELGDILIGHNARILGLSRYKALSRYSESFVEQRAAIGRGYDDWAEPELLMVEVDLDRDGQGMIDAVRQALPDWGTLGYSEYISDGDSYFIRGIGRSYYGAFEHKDLAIIVVPHYSTMVHVDGSSSSYWSVDVGFIATSRWYYNATSFRIGSGSFSWRNDTEIVQSFCCDLGDSSPEDCAKRILELVQEIQGSVTLVEGTAEKPFVYPGYCHLDYAGDYNHFWNNLGSLTVRVE